MRLTKSDNWPVNFPSNASCYQSCFLDGICSLTSYYMSQWHVFTSSLKLTSLNFTKYIQGLHFQLRISVSPEYTFWNSNLLVLLLLTEFKGSYSKHGQYKITYDLFAGHLYYVILKFPGWRWTSVLFSNHSLRRIFAFVPIITTLLARIVSVNWWLVF